MFNVFETEKNRIRLEAEDNQFLYFLGGILSLIIAFILATREFGIAADDYNYLNHFKGTLNTNAESIILTFIEEPFWKFYTYSITLLVSPENALRLTIFFSSFLFLTAVNRINPRFFLIVSIAFVLHQHFAVQMYFNQIRQGFALSLFLFITVYFKRPIWAGVIVSFIHTSFLIPLLLIFLISRIQSILWIMIYSLLGVIFLFFSIGLIENLDLGRRTDIYAFQSDLTINYYISTIIRYLPLILFIYFYGNYKLSFWYRLALSSLIFILPFTLFYDAAGRIMYYVSAFFLLVVLEQSRNLGGKLGLAYYMLFLLIDLILLDTTVISEWRLILIR